MPQSHGSTDIVLGVDSGGTKTILACVNRAATITYWQTGAGLDPIGTDTSDATLRALLDPMPRPVAATLGLPCHGEVARITDQQVQTARDFFGQQARVVNDVAIAHIGAFAGDVGVLVLSGTGSMAWAKGPGGKTRAGGFSHIFGDEGSAYWIGREALSAASREIDGRAAATGFATALCHAIGATPDSLIAWTYERGNARHVIASVARQVSNLAQDGFPAAQAILQAAAQELAGAGQAAARRAGLGTAAPWATGGSVFSDAIIASETARLMGSPPQQPRLPPIGGALLDAARTAGWPVDDAWIAALSRKIDRHLSA